MNRGLDHGWGKTINDIHVQLFDEEVPEAVLIGVASQMMARAMTHKELRQAIWDEGGRHLYGCDLKRGQVMGLDWSHEMTFESRTPIHIPDRIVNEPVEIRPMLTESRFTIGAGPSSKGYVSGQNRGTGNGRAVYTKTS